MVAILRCKGAIMKTEKLTFPCLPSHFNQQAIEGPAKMFLCEIYTPDKHISVIYELKSEF